MNETDLSTFYIINNFGQKGLTIYIMHVFNSRFFAVLSGSDSSSVIFQSVSSMSHLFSLNIGWLFQNIGIQLIVLLPQDMEVV